MKEQLNKELQEQLKKHFGGLDNVPGGLDSFLKAVSDYYDSQNNHKNLEANDLGHADAKVAKADMRAAEGDTYAYTNREMGIFFNTVKEVFFSAEFAFTNGKMSSRLVQISPGCENVYGYPQSDFLAESDLWYNLILDEDKAIINQEFSLLLQGKVSHDEHRILHKDGTIKWVESRITPTLNKDGQLARIDGVTLDITEKKQAEERVKRSELMMAEAQRIALFGSWELDLVDTNDLSNNPLVWSDEVYRIFGYEPGEVEVTNELFFNAVHPDDREAISQAVQEALETNSRYSIDHRLVLRNGGVKWVHEDATILCDKNSGKALRMIGTVQDITERKQVELMLKNAEANLRNIFENTDTAYVLLDSNASVLSYNRLAYELAKSDLLAPLAEGKNYIDLMPDERKSDVLKKIHSVIQERKSISYEIGYPGDGTTGKWLYVRMHPIINDENHVLGLSVAATNIDDRKHAEQLLQESNERYQLATKATNDIIWDWDIPADKMYRSDNYGGLFGYVSAGDNLYEESWDLLIHPEDRERVLSRLDQTINNPTEILWEDEYRHFKKSGEIAYIQDRGYIVHDDSGKPIRMVGAMRDITDSKVAELEKDKITSELISKNKDLEQFAYIVSHNLRAPVANIMGTTELLEQGELPENERMELLSGLKFSISKLDSVIKDLNHVLQAKQGLYKQKEEVYFEELVKDIIRSIQDVYDREEVSIQTDFESVNKVITIKSYLYSIFYNLILNSIKYRNPKISPVIEISSCIQNDELVLTLKDNGLGFDLKKHGDYVFGLYKRFHQNKNIEGKGMGLFMVKTQVESLGGTIDLKSQPNQGAEFIISFKL